MVKSQSKRSRSPLAASGASRKVIVDFPDPLYEETQKAADELSINRSVLIRRAVHEYLRRLERQKLARELAEGYRANADLHQKVSDEFKYVDAENV
jgi:metal-responsive CopG/Arc/MetJ family transcriptional regulator